MAQQIHSWLFIDSLSTLGLYGVYKSETIPSKWKKAIYAALVFTIIGSTILYSV
jgi:hypothetical protein